MRKLLHIAATLAIMAVLAGACADDPKRICTTTEVRADRPDGGYDHHYTKTCVDAPK